MLAHHLVGRSPEPSPCGHAAIDVSGSTDVASLRRATRSGAPKHLGMREPHPAHRIVLLARSLPSHERFRTRPGHRNLTGTERVFSSRRASRRQSTTNVRHAREPLFLPTPEAVGFLAGSG